MKKYSILSVIARNLFLVFYFGLGAIGMSFLQIYGIPVLSVFYVIFLAIMLVFVLKKHLCTTCYYYGKLCSTGWENLPVFYSPKIREIVSSE